MSPAARDFVFYRIYKLDYLQFLALSLPEKSLKFSFVDVQYK